MMPDFDNTSFAEIYHNLTNSNFIDILVYSVSYVQNYPTPLLYFVYIYCIVVFTIFCDPHSK